MDLPECRAADDWVQTRAGRLFARTWTSVRGDAAGEPILLFHESLGCVELWRGFPAALCAGTGRRVVAYDRLGFGRSDARTGPLPADFVAAEAGTCVPALQAQLGFDRFVAYGHSVGGGMAVHCAAAGGCAALVTESAQSFVEDRTLEGIRATIARFTGDDSLEKLRRFHGERTDWVYRAWTETWLAPGFAGWSLEDALPRVVCPTLVLHGSDDAYGSPRHAERIAHGVRGAAQLVVLDGVHHHPHREREAKVVQLVAGFLERPGA